MPSIFFIVRNYTSGRIARSSKIEGLKGIMGCPKQEGVSPIKGNGSLVTCRFRASLKHKDDGQNFFIKPNSQR